MRSCGTARERRGAHREARAERHQHRVLRQTCPQRALQHEQNARRRHIAKASEDLALVVEAPRLEPERSLNRLDDLAAAGMADEAADVTALQGLRLQDRIDSGCKALAREGGNR